MDPLVSVSWLATHLGDPGLVVLDATLPPVGVVPAVDTQARYQARHIPGAVFFDIDALSDHTSTLPHMLPSPSVFAADVGALGIGEGMTIVVYEQGGVFSAPRAWWMLRTMGAAKVYVLDGGLPAWIAAGEPVEAGTVSRQPVPFTAHFNASVVYSFDQLQQALHEEVGATQVIDARPAGRFDGTAPEPRAGVRSGHMPGAISLPFTALVQDGRLKSPEQVRSEFAARAVNLDRPIVTSCGSGVTAAVLLLALERSGATQVKLYDGSWAEYAQRPEAQVVTGQA